MNRTIVAASVVLCIFAAGCGRDDGREPGDDPTRADEGPTAGRPVTEAVPPKDASGGAEPADIEEAAPGKSRGTLDGPSEETTAPDRPQ
jgi:hypothetical protein